MSSLVASPPHASRSLALRARVESRARVAPVASVACSRSRRATVVVASGPVRRPAHRLDDARLVPVVSGALHRARSILRATSIPRAADGDSTELSDGVTLDRALELSSVVKFAVPLLATNIVTPLLTMTDTAFVGRCAVDSVVQLAALGVSTPLTDYTVTLAAFIPAGLTNIISAGVASGESRESLAEKTYGALVVSLALSLCLVAVLVLFPEPLLAWLKTPPEVMATAANFTRIRAVGMPAAYLTTAAYAVLVARKDTTSPLRCVCLAAFVNVALDWIAVGVMGGGAAGAAWATSIALWTGCVAILNEVRKKGFTDAFPWGELRWKGQLAPVMAFAGPITFLVFALLSIYTALILFANSLGVVVSAAHRIAGNIFAVAVLCGDPLIQAGQAFMPKYLLPEVPRRVAAGKMATLLREVGLAAGTFAAIACGVTCILAGGAFTRDPAVIAQLRAVTTPMCAAVVANVVSKSMYGVTVAAKQLGFLAGITGVGLAFFAGSLWHMNRTLVGPELYYWMWWVVFGYYALAVAAIQIRSFGAPGLLRGLFSDDGRGEGKEKEGGGEVAAGA